MVIEEVHTVLAPKKHFGMRLVVSPLRSTKYFGENALLTLNPITLEPLE